MSEFTVFDEKNINKIQKLLNSSYNYKCSIDNSVKQLGGYYKNSHVIAVNFKLLKNSINELNDLIITLPHLHHEIHQLKFMDNFENMRSISLLDFNQFPELPPAPLRDLPPDELLSINCSSNQLGFLPEINNKLSLLDFNQFPELPPASLRDLPPSPDDFNKLFFINCSFNQLDVLP